MRSIVRSMWCPEVSRGFRLSEADGEIDSEIDRCPVVSRGVTLNEIDSEIEREIDTEIDVVPRGVPWCP